MGPIGIGEPTPAGTSTACAPRQGSCSLCTGLSPHACPVSAAAQHLQVTGRAVPPGNFPGTLFSCLFQLLVPALLGSRPPSPSSNPRAVCLPVPLPRLLSLPQSHSFPLFLSCTCLVPSPFLTPPSCFSLMRTPVTVIVPSRHPSFNHTFKVPFAT